jgi:hypothetical protein
MVQAAVSDVIREGGRKCTPRSLKSFAEASHALVSAQLIPRFPVRSSVSISAIADNALTVRSFTAVAKQAVTAETSLEVAFRDLSNSFEFEITLHRGLPVEVEFCGGHHREVV